MKATLKLEAIGHDACVRFGGMKKMFRAMGAQALWGDDIEAPSHPWVAKITGLWPSGKFQREFLRGTNDYSEANSKGSRGVFVWYMLESGNYYDVYELISWKNDDRYLCKVDDEGNIIYVDEKEIQVYFERKIMKGWQEKKNGAREQTHDRD
ncbi:MAG: hypothetical protein ABFC78_06440 [Methanoregula sp.]